MTTREQRNIERVSDYLRECAEVLPEFDPPTAEEIRDALDCAAEPITLFEVREALAADTADMRAFREAEEDHPIG